MPNLFARSVVRESLVLVTVAAVWMALWGPGGSIVPAAAAVGATLGIVLLRRLRGRSVLVTILGSAMGAAVLLAVVGFAGSLFAPLSGVQHKWGHGPQERLSVGGLLFLIGGLVGSVYGLIAGLALKFAGGRESGPRKQAQETEAAGPEAHAQKSPSDP